MSNRAITRKKLILDYIEKHRICTKYEITREIRNYEQEQGLKGCIDAKTTKRMLISLENDKKLHIFNVQLKNLSYMGVRAFEITETDSSFLNYCATFNRTFDSVDSKFKSEIDQSESASCSDLSLSQPETSTLGNEQPSLNLTRSFINSVVDRLHFSTSYSKVYALVPKFQKALVLHRLLHYILFFYDGRPSALAELDADVERELRRNLGKDADIVDSCALPPADKTFRLDAEGKSSWQTYIPPLNRPKDSLPVNHVENNCIFIGEIFSHMPISVFCSLIVINHHVPGLVALLKHPQKRHILVKDLPPTIIAPLIYERRYLQRMLAILQLLGCLGLITFVESPCKTNQAINRDVQSQMVYVHRKAVFYDTSSNKAKDWNELKQINRDSIKVFTFKMTKINKNFY
jgi:general transcription factor 3C polypeptide 1